MSVIFGVCLPPGGVVEKITMSYLAEATTRYGSDSTDLHVQGRIGMGFQAFHTHLRSQIERQPAVDALGNILVFDGRLDNHEELAAREDIMDGSVPDSALILKAFVRSGENCFSRFVGDWALALWSARDRTLYLARDHAGSRTLFYTHGSGGIKWSTYVETFIANSSFLDLDPEYIAHFLSGQEIRDMTPYKSIRSVPPAHYVVVREGRVSFHPHWRWIADTRITYGSDAEYDEHFFQLFQQAVRRRIGPGEPVLAELSGGMDSSSIVCMADKIAKDERGSSSPIETVSYYDDTEPDWDERPYFEAVEAQRNKRGIHIDWSARTPNYEPLMLSGRIYPYPGADRTWLDIADQFELNVGSGRYRVILSGIGGDELTGGVPTPIPELADRLREGRIFRLFSRAAEWCMISRQPMIYMLFNTAAFTFNLYRASRPDRNTVPPWLAPQLSALCLRPHAREQKLYTLLAKPPSAINNGRVWWSLLETLPHLFPQIAGNYEYRYPYLDRDLVEFLHRVPREQLVAPARRRLLMRRALKEIVPVEILERKRKGYLSHGPLSNLRNAQKEIEDLFSNPLTADVDLINRLGFLVAFHAELAGELKWIGPLMKTIGMELWLRSLKASNVNFRVAS
jgi:asparagine synthase (glutamine-hydrolysing)